MGDYVRDLELELLRTGRARQQRRLSGWRRRGPRVPPVTLGGVLVALSSAAVVAVFVVAIAVIGHRGPPPGKPAYVTPATRGLASKLACASIELTCLAAANARSQARRSALRRAASRA